MHPKRVTLHMPASGGYTLTSTWYTARCQKHASRHTVK